MNKKLMLSLLFIGVVVAVYFPVFHSSYMLNFDDNTHVFYNTLARDRSWLIPLDIFLTPDTANKTYVPLTVLTFFYENVFWGLHSWLSHGINLVIHLAVCGLAFVFGEALGLTVFASYVGALLFAIHPIHVEPVAWVTARKDLLYSFFFLASILSYLRYIDSNKGKDYIFALISAVLSVLSKPMGLSLPLVLFLLDGYRSRPFSWKLLIEKVPFFFVIQLLALITYIMNARIAYLTWDHSPLLWIWCASFYVQKFFYPVNLSAVYEPSIPINLYNPEYILAISLLVILLFLIWHLRRQKLVIFTAGLYIFSLFYIWRFDLFDLTFVADRYMYLPSLGICFILGNITERLWHSKYRLFSRPLILAFLCLIMVLSHDRTRAWKNTFSLWTENLKTNQSAFVLNAYGESLLEDNCFKDNKEDFIAYLSSFLGTSPAKFKKVYAHSLKAKIDASRRIIGLRSFQRLLISQPNNLDAISNIGFLYTLLGRYEKAVHYFDRAIAISKSQNGDYFFQRGVTHEYLKRPDLALIDYTRAIALRCMSEPQARLNRANILMKNGALNESLEEIFMVIEAMPGYDQAYDLAIKVAQLKNDLPLVDKIKKYHVYIKKHITQK